MAVDLLLFVIVICAWSIVFLLFRISSLSALVSIIALVISAYNIPNVQYKEVFLIAGLIILISHAKNILKLIQGKEQKLKYMDTDLKMHIDMQEKIFICIEKVTIKVCQVAKL